MPVTVPVNVFQFHKGAIGVISPVVPVAVALAFQFHKGAIGVHLSSTLTVTKFFISIP